MSKPKLIGIPDKYTPNAKADYRRGSRAAKRWERSRFEIDRKFYRRARHEMVKPGEDDQIRMEEAI